MKSFYEIMLLVENAECAEMWRNTPHWAGYVYARKKRRHDRKASAKWRKRRGDW